MLRRPGAGNGRTYVSRAVALLPVVVLLLVMGLAAQVALAGRLSDTTAGLPKATTGPSSGISGAPRDAASGSAPGIPNPKSGPSVPKGDGFMTLDPSIDTNGNVPNPNNGDTVNTGDSFALDVNVHGNSSSNLTAAQAYFAYGINPGDTGYAYVVEAGPLAVACVLTQTVKADVTTFDTVLQNEWCNGEAGPCVFRGIATPIGWGAIALGALNTCPTGCGPDFRIATIPLCAWTPGQFTIHWQFSPPEPITRDTQLVDSDNTIWSDPSLFTDFVLNIVGTALDTPTVTPTPLPTNTRTVTPTRTNTRTFTATRTPTSAVTSTPTPTRTATPTNTPSNTPTNTPNEITPTETTDTPTNTPTFTNTASNTPSNTPTNTPTNTPADGATNTPTDTPTETPPPTCENPFHYFVPEGNGPPNGGTVNTGDKFVLDMMVSTGTYFVTAQQAYLQFSSNLMRNVEVNSSGCVLITTVTPDLSVLDAALQNEVCNGPEPCVFRGVAVAPGSLAWASGALINPPYNGPDFRVARVAFCAIAPGTATLHWEFTPPAPVERDTQIVDENSQRVNDRTCYQDYVINIVGTALTPTPTFTQAPTNTATITRTPTNTRTATNTPTDTPTNTATNTPTDTPTDTPTSPATDTPTITLTSTATNTSTPTNTRTNTRTSTSTNTRTATNTPVCQVSAFSTDVPKAIPDFNGAQGIATSTLTISGIGAISDINLVGLVISHTYIGDLRVSLTSPSGTLVRLIGRVCNTAPFADFNNITIDDAAAAAIGSTCPVPADSTFRPGGAGAGTLSVFNGQNASGTWTLTISDNAAQDTGTLWAWGLSIRSGAPCPTIGPSNTPTDTPTRTSTRTPTNTATATNTPVCQVLAASNDVPKTICDLCVVTSTLTIGGIGSIADVDLTGLDVTHTYIGDLAVELVSPGGTSVTLINRVCNNTRFQNFSNITLDDSASAAIGSSCPPTANGRFRPSNPLSAFNGQNGSGTWLLRVSDLAAQDSGTINTWGLAIRSNDPCPATTPTVTTTDTPTDTPTSPPTDTPTETPVPPTDTPTDTPTPPPCNGAFHYLIPETGSDPANGGTVTTGQKFTLDMWVNTGGYTLTAQQAYLTFTNSIANVVDYPSASCVPTTGLTADLTVFDALLQNEVCNGFNPCIFRGIQVDAGTIAFASGALNNPPYSGPDFLVAHMSLCAHDPGDLVLHWQFSPPAPITRNTALVDENTNTVSDRNCYEDYVIHVIGPSLSPTPTFTPSGTPTLTRTRTATPTRTLTATITPTSAATNTPTSTPTNTTSNTPTSTPSTTPTNTPTSTPTNTPTNTFTSTSTNTPTNTFTPSSTFTSTPTNTPTNTFTSTSTNTPTNTPTDTFTPTNTFTGTPTNTPTNTPTDTFTNTPTDTSIPATSTPTRTPPAVCPVCPSVRSVSISCNPDGSIHWTATVNNPGSCTLTTSWKAQLLGHRTGQGGFSGIRLQPGSSSFPPGNTTVSGDFCVILPSNVNTLRVEFSIDSTMSGCTPVKKSHTMHVCRDTPTCTLMFSDVGAEDPYYSQVSFLGDSGVVSGYADGTFRPYSSVTRAQVAKIVVLAFGYPPAAPDGQRFSDVPVDDPFASYIATAYANGLVSGYMDGTLRPSNNVTRGQLAKIVVQAANLKLDNPETPTFNDVAAGSTFYRYIETAYSHGLLTGYPDGTFRVGEQANRGQVCKITMNAAFPPEE